MRLGWLVPASCCFLKRARTSAAVVFGCQVYSHRNSMVGLLRSRVAAKGWPHGRGRRGRASGREEADSGTAAGPGGVDGGEAEEGWGWERASPPTGRSCCAVASRAEMRGAEMV